MQAIVHSRYGPPDALELKDIDSQSSPTIRCWSGCTPLLSAKGTG
jgi:hypothetical protein